MSDTLSGRLASTGEDTTPTPDTAAQLLAEATTLSEQLGDAIVVPFHIGGPKEGGGTAKGTTTKWREVNRPWTQPDDVRRWGRRHQDIKGCAADAPTNAIAVRCDNIFVIDIDNPDLAAGLAERHQPETRTHKTVSGGTHWLFERDDALVAVVPCARAAAGQWDIKEGPGALIVSPPSKGYALERNGPLAPMTDAMPLLAELAKIKPAHSHIPKAAEMTGQTGSQWPCAWLEDALTHVDPTNYTSWVETGMSIHTASGGSEEGLAIWDQWSKAADSYAEGECAKKWGTFGGSPSPRGLGSIWVDAIAGGWTPPEKETAPSPAPLPEHEKGCKWCGASLPGRKRWCPADKGCKVAYETLEAEWTAHHRGIARAQRKATAAKQAAQGTAPTPTKSYHEISPIDADSRTLRAQLAHIGVDLRLNSRGGLPELFVHAHHKTDIPHTGMWTAVTDNLQACLIEAVARECLWGSNPDKAYRASWAGTRWNQATRAHNVSHTEDAFLADFIDLLPLWDDVPRIDTALEECFTLDEDTDLPYARRLLAGILLGVLARAANPGEQHDELVMLLGPQGIGKSTFVKGLLPPEHRSRWFSDSVKFDHGPQAQQRFVEATQGKVLVESSELLGLTRTDIEAIKNLLSSGGPDVRMAYKEFKGHFPPVAVLVGTSNDDYAVPADPTGARRFLPVRFTSSIGRANVALWLDRNRVQLWAEAKARIDAGEQHWLPDKFKPAQAEAAERHRSRDELLETLIDTIVTEITGTGGVVTTVDVAHSLGSRLPQGARLPSSKAIGVLLRHLGWRPEQSRVAGKVTRYWVRDRLSVPDVPDVPDSSNAEESTPNTAPLGLGGTNGTSGTSGAPSDDPEADPERLTDNAREMMGVQYPTPAHETHGPEPLEGM